MATHPSPIPTLLLERLAAGELSEQERAALMARYDHSPHDLEREVEALRSQHAEILAAYPPEEFAKAVQNQLERTPPRARSSSQTPRKIAWLAIPATLAAAAAAWVMTSPVTSTPPSSSTQAPPVQDHILLKGERPDALKIWRAAKPENQRLEQGDHVSQGDTIQLQYFSAHDTSGAIFSIDGRGIVTLHHPETAQSAALLEQGTHTLPYSYTLDDAPSYERFFLVECAHEIDATKLLEHARDFSKIAAPDARRARFTLPEDYDCTSHSIWLDKEAR